MRRRFESAPYATDRVTDDGLAVYDLAPLASELWFVAGPAGVDPATIDPDDLPAGFRWVEGEEWESLLLANANRNS